MGRIHLAAQSAVIGIFLFLIPISGAWACTGLTSISPTSGPAGTVVTLTGDGFSYCNNLDITLTRVTFGGIVGTSLQVDSATSATVVVPAGSGTVDVTATIEGTLYTLHAAFTYTTDTSTNTSGTDSQNLQTTMGGVSTTAGTTSNQVITNAVDGAANDAFSGGGSSVTGGANGFALNFAAVPRKSGAQVAADALAYADDRTDAPAALSPMMRDWSLWADIRGSGFDRHDAFNTKGGQLNLTAGVGRKLTPDLLIGLFGGYETYDYKTASVGGKVRGNGGSIGGYAAVRVAESWRADAMLGWTSVSYNASTGTASGATDGSRWLASGGLTGTYRFGAAVFEPSARITALWERDAAWTDSLGTTQAARDFSAGRVSAGGKLVLPWPTATAARLSSYLGLYGDYRFSSDSALAGGALNVGIEDGITARVTAGITATLPTGLMLSLGGEFGGIGSGYYLWSAQARAASRF